MKNFIYLSLLIALSFVIIHKANAQDEGDKPDDVKPSEKPAVDCVSPYSNCVGNITDLDTENTKKSNCYTECGYCRRFIWRGRIGRPPGGWTGGNCSVVMECQNKCEADFNATDAGGKFYGCGKEQNKCVNDNPSCSADFNKCVDDIKTLRTTQEKYGNCSTDCWSENTDFQSEKYQNCSNNCQSDFENSPEVKSQTECQTQQNWCTYQCSIQYDECRVDCSMKYKTLEKAQPCYDACSNVQQPCSWMTVY